MNTVKYFADEVDIDTALSTAGNDVEEHHVPERIPTSVRVTMEELGYRSAVWYGPKGEALMYYKMTVDGVRPVGIKK